MNRFQKYYGKVDADALKQNQETENNSETKTMFDYEQYPSWNSCTHENFVFTLVDRFNMGGYLYKSVECMLLICDVRSDLDKIYDADIKDDVILYFYANGQVFRMPLSSEEYERDLEHHIREFNNIGIDFRSVVTKMTIEAKPNPKARNGFDRKFTFEFSNKEYVRDYFWNLPCIRKGLVDMFQNEINILNERLQYCARLIQEN